MPMIDLHTFATVLATYAREKLPAIHRAALLVRSTTDGSIVAAVFGNDEYANNPQALQEVELLRAQLKEAQIDELAFGVTGDGRSWALLVRADTSGLQTALGRAFRAEMLRAYLNDAVWAAWRTAGGVPVKEANWPIFDVPCRSAATGKAGSLHSAD